MSKDMKYKMVPRLRFPELREAEGWEEKAFKQLFSIGSGKDYKHLSKGDIPVYGSGGYMLSVNDFLYEGESVCIGRKGTIDKPQLISGKFWTVDTLFYTHSFKDCLPKFIHLAFLNINWQKYSEAGGIPSLSKTIIENIEVFIPKIPEQQKIADCLSSLDDLIAVQNQKLDALKTHKKGLMQQLFPAEGETVPRLRFPEFLDAGEWEETTIGGIGSFYYGKSAPKWSLEENALTPCVRYGELYTKFGAIISETYSRTNIDPSNLRFSKGGEILVPRVGEKPEDFGKCCAYLPLENIAIGEMISVFETAQNPIFYTYYFRGMYKQFAKVVEGQNVKNLYYVELEPLPIYRPSLPEQQRIADCLSSLDDLIAAQSQKLEALKTHKKALMQQLFPNPNEIEE
jgi:type I restriction enzyme, S subunit